MEGIIAICISVATALGAWAAWRKSRDSVLRDNVKDLHDRVRLLEAQEERHVRQIFDQGIQITDLEENNKRLGRTNLRQQRELDDAQRRMRQFQRALETSNIEAPEPNGDEEE